MATAEKAAASRRDYKGLFINGDWVEPSTGQYDDIVNPATEEVIGSAPAGSEADTDKAIAAARHAFDEGPWATMDRHARAAKMQDFHDALMRRQEEIINLIILEAGATQQFAPFHFLMPMGHLQNFIEISKTDPITPLPVSLNPNMQGGKTLGGSVIVREPAGVVSAITPYNFPFLVNMSKVAPALAAGCTVILKSSPFTPLQTLIYGEIAQEVDLPPGVLNIVAGGAEVGHKMSSDERVDMVTFTGSEAIGAKVMEAASRTIKKVTLELGGKSPLIIRKDADMDQAVMGALGAQTVQCGQACARTSRIIVDNAIKGEFVERLIDAVKYIKIGDPAQPDTVMGPLIREIQRERVNAAVQAGIKSGQGKLITGGKVPEGQDKGYFYEVTLFDDVQNESELGQEEIFGPVGVIIGFDTDEEAVKIANSSKYGLGGGIISADAGTAFEMACKVRTGQMAINGGSGGFPLNEPFGGYKRSGIGREFGQIGYDEYTEVKAISYHAG